MGRVAVLGLSPVLGGSSLSPRSTVLTVGFVRFVMLFFESRKVPSVFIFRRIFLKIKNEC